MSELAGRRSRAWSIVFRGAYRFLRLIDPLLRSWLANGLPGLDRVVEIRTIGGRSGRRRTSLVTLLVVEGRGYLGHPNGTAGWIRNALAAGWVEIDADGAAERRTFTLLSDGAERDGVIRATWRQQPFPANLLYRAASRHVAAVGVYGRLDPPRVNSAGSRVPAEGPERSTEVDDRGLHLDDKKGAIVTAVGEHVHPTAVATFADLDLRTRLPVGAPEAPNHIGDADGVNGVPLPPAVREADRG